MLLVLPVLLPLAVSFYLFRQKDAERRTFAVRAVTLADAALAVLLCLLPDRRLDLLTIEGDLRLTLGVDGLSRFFLVLVAGVWVAAVFYAGPYLSHAGRERQFYGFFTLTLGAIMGLALAQNFVTLYMFFELMSLLSTPLVLHDGTQVSRSAALKYLGYSVFGAALALAGFFVLSGHLSTLDFLPGGGLDPACGGAERPLLLAAWFVMVLGFGCKAGLLPMQAWLTTAHPVAPAPASAVLSGVITKAGVLAILRVTFYQFGADFLRGSWAQETLLVLSMLTIFAGSMLAFKEKRLKKRLAYSTVSQVSYALFGILLLSAEGLRGALLQVTFHALAKDTLFFAAGAVIMVTGHTKAADLRGIGRRMPATMWCFALAALSLIGIPPLGGFISKWYLAMGALSSNLRGIALVGVAVLMLSALLTAGYLLPIVTGGFFPGEGEEITQQEAPPAMLVPMAVLAGAALLLGIFPGPLSDWIGGLLPGLF